jgi:hypothetical protein
MQRRDRKLTQTGQQLHYKYTQSYSIKKGIFKCLQNRPTATGTKVVTLKGRSNFKGDVRREKGKIPE